MTTPPTRDFFLSYNHADRQWAIWIGTQLTAANYTFYAQYQDMPPGTNFILKMHEATKYSRRTLALLSPDFLTSEFCAPEWAGAFVHDPTGNGRKLIPVRVQPCQPDGLLTAIVNINLVGHDEPKAREELLTQLEGKIPTATFPGVSSANFPNAKTKFRIFTGQLPTVDRYLVGREDELDFLDKAWDNPETNAVQVIASGGTGKTALMDKWLRGHIGEATVFGWSFYSQGTSPDRQTSSDPFFAEALRFFQLTVDPTASPYAKAEALAHRLREERVLLILDGVEPLQDKNGDLKDQALKALLHELDTANAGLVLCTTRVRLTDLPDDTGSLILDNLSPTACRAYLRKLGVQGEDQELEQAAKDYGHHALALTLLGHYLVDFCEADVRKTADIHELPLDGKSKPAKHAQRILAAYERTLAGEPELDILKALGYFDRPAERDALQLVLSLPDAKPSDLTSRFTNSLRALFTTSTPKVPHASSLEDDKYKAALKRLRELRLILDADGSPDLDGHPLIREHFAQYATPEGHGRLYEHYQKQAPQLPDTLAEMTPLFYAIYHGCRAGRHQEVAEKVYRDRVRRGDEAYLNSKLGANGTDLALLANFFTVSQTPWTQPIATLSPAAQSWVIGSAAFALRALGRLADAVDPMRAGAEALVAQEDWQNVARSYGNLSELLLTLGRVGEAVSAAEKSVDFADRSGDAFIRMRNRTTLADARHQAGDLAGARTLFAEAERLQVESQPDYPILYSLAGYRYCDLLLGQGEAAEVRRRATQTLAWVEQHGDLLSVALDHLSLARAGAPSLSAPAIDGLRRAGHLRHLPTGLLARGTQYDLDEVYKIATRSGMRLHLTDYHLQQAKLDLANGNQTKARENTQKAADLIQATGYHRRDPDLALLHQQLEPNTTPRPQPRT